MNLKRLLALAAVVALAGCTTTTCSVSPPVPTVPAGTPSTDHGNSEAVRAVGSQHCGLERWAVKTGTDADAGLIDLHTVMPTTIAHLTTMPAPAILPPVHRVKPVEVTVYQVKATLKEFKQESDSDYHLVLTDGAAHMIAEIPDPACVGASSPLLPGITAARAQFNAKYHPGGTWQQSGVQVTVTGVGFYDTLHGQTGVAPNGIEIHPILDIQFTGGPGG